MAKTILLSILGFVCFCFILLFGPIQEVEIAHCALSGLLGVIIVLVSIVISKINKVLNFLSFHDDKTE